MNWLRNWFEKIMKDIFHMNEDVILDENVIRIELEDLPPDPATIFISEKDLEMVTPILSTVEDLGAIEIPDIPCAFCHTMINPGEAFGKCRVCGTPYHEVCWKECGGCSVLGCRGSRDRSAFVPSKTL